MWQFSAPGLSLRVAWVQAPLSDGYQLAGCNSLLLSNPEANPEGVVAELIIDACVIGITAGDVATFAQVSQALNNVSTDQVLVPHIAFCHVLVLDQTRIRSRSCFHIWRTPSIFKVKLA
jgi:hypothetical protein